MVVIEVKENKKQYLDLLLLADEQEDMIDRYLDKGRMYILNDNGIKCECVVTDEGNGVLKIKNIATVPEYQGKGYAKALVDFLVKEYGGEYSILQVGRDPEKFCVKRIKYFRSDKAKSRRKRSERKYFYYGKSIKRVIKGICKQPEIHKYNRHHEQHEGIVQ